jgi:hypothetical protein
MMKRHSCDLHWQKHQHWAFAFALESEMRLLLDRLCSTLLTTRSLFVYVEAAVLDAFAWKNLFKSTPLLFGEGWKSASNSNSSLIVE